MSVTFDGKNFREQTITCPNCGWSGKGADVHIIDLYGLSKMKEVHCPDCDYSLGSLNEDSGPPGESPDPLSYQIG